MQKKFGWTLLLGCLFALSMTPVQAGKALDRLNAFLVAKGGMRADFVQTVKGSAFSQPKESRGTLIMQRPGKFRWDYQTPYQQLILADGKRLWVYDPDLAQVVVKPLGLALGDTPALLLSGKGLGGKGLNDKGLNGKGALQERFVTTEQNESPDGLYWVQLLPKEKDANFQEVRLGFGEKSIRRMDLMDGFGQLTRLDFSGVEENIKLPEGSFEFVPPKGVDVVGDPDVDAGK